MKYKIKRFSHTPPTDKTYSLRKTLLDYVRGSSKKERELPGSSELYEKLRDKLKESGVEYETGKGKGGSHYEPKSLVRRLVAESLDHKPTLSSLKSEYGVSTKTGVLRNAIKEAAKDGVSLSKTPDKIHISDNSVGTPSILAHEYGHYLDHLKHPRLNAIKDRSTNDLIKRSKVGSIINSGIKYGTKLITEANASRYGRRVMKELGASKDQLSQATKSLLGSYGSYVLPKLSKE